MPQRTKSNTSNGKKGAAHQSSHTPSQRTQDAKPPAAVSQKPNVNKGDPVTEDDAARTPTSTPVLPPPQTAAEIPNYVEAYLRLKQQEQQNLDAQRTLFVPQVTKTSFPPVTGVRRGEKGGLLFDSHIADPTAALRTSKKRPRTDASGTGSTMEVLADTSDEDDNADTEREKNAETGGRSTPSAAGSAQARTRAYAEPINEASAARMKEEILAMLQHPELALAASGALRSGAGGGASRRSAAEAAGSAEEAAAAAQWEQCRNLVTDAQRKAWRQQQSPQQPQKDSDTSSHSSLPAPSDEEVALAMFTEISRISHERRNLGSATATAAASAGGAAVGADGSGPTEREVQAAMAESMRQILGMSDYDARGGLGGHPFASGALGSDAQLLGYDEGSDDVINLQLAIEDQKNRTRALQGLQSDTLQTVVDSSHYLSFPGSGVAASFENKPATDELNRAAIAQRLGEFTTVAGAMLLQMLDARLTDNASELALLSQGKEETHKYLSRLHQCLHHELHTLPDDRMIDMARCVGLLSDNDLHPDPNTIDPDSIYETLSAIGAILFFASLPLSLLEKVCTELGISMSDEASMDRLVLGEALAEKIACHIHRVKLSLSQFSFVPRLQVHEHAPGSYTCTVDRASCLGLLPKERLLSNRFSCSRIRLRAVLTTSQSSSGALSLHVWHRHNSALTAHMLVRTSEPKKKKKKSGTPTPAAADEDEETRASSALCIEQEGVVAPGQCFGFEDFVPLELALDSPTTLQYGLRTYNKSDDRLVFQVSVSLENADGSSLPASNKQRAAGQQILNQSFDSVPASNATGTTNHLKGSVAGGGGAGQCAGSVIDKDALLRHALKQAFDDLELEESAARTKLEAEWRTSFTHLQNDEVRGVRTAKQITRERLFAAQMAKVSAPPELVRESEKLTQSVQNARQQVQKMEKDKAKEERDAAKTDAKLAEATQELERLTAKLQHDRQALADLEKEVKAIQASSDAKQQRVREHNERKKVRSQQAAQRKRAAAQATQLQQHAQAPAQARASVQTQKAQQLPPATAILSNSSGPHHSASSTPAKAPRSLATNVMPPQGPLTTAAPSPADAGAAMSAAMGGPSSSSAVGGGVPGAADGSRNARPISSLFIPDFGTFLSHTSGAGANNSYEMATGQTASAVSGSLMGSSSIPGAGASGTGGGAPPALGRLFSTAPAMRVQQQQEHQQHQQQRRSIPESPANGFIASTSGDLGLATRVTGAGGSGSGLLPPFGTTTPGNNASTSSNANHHNSGGTNNATLGSSAQSYAQASSPSSPGGFRMGSASGSRTPHAATNGGEDAIRGGLSPAIGTPASLGAASSSGIVGSRLGTNSLFANSTASPFVFSTGAGGAAGGAGAAGVFLPSGGGNGASPMTGLSGHNSPPAALGNMQSAQPMSQQSTPLFSTKAPGSGSGASSTVGNNANNNTNNTNSDAIGFNAAPGSSSPSPVPTSSSMFQSFQVVGGPSGDVGAVGPASSSSGGFGLSAFTTNPASRNIYGGGHLDSDVHGFSAPMEMMSGGGGLDMGATGGGAHPFTVSAGGSGHANAAPLYGIPGLGFPGDGLSGSGAGAGAGRPASAGSMNLNQLLFHTSALQSGNGAVGAIGSNTPPPGQGPQSPMAGIFDPTNGLPYQW